MMRENRLDWKTTGESAAISSLAFFVCGSDEERNLISLKDDDMIAYTMLFYEPQELTKEEFEETSAIGIIWCSLLYRLPQK